METQTVWRTISGGGSAGYFLWDVLEVIGEPFGSNASYLTKCRDGSFVLIMCFHFWTRDQADEWAGEQYAFLPTTLIQIP